MQEADQGAKVLGVNPGTAAAVDHPQLVPGLVLTKVGMTVVKPTDPYQHIISLLKNSGRPVELCFASRQQAPPQQAPPLPPPPARVPMSPESSSLSVSQEPFHSLGTDSDDEREAFSVLGGAPVPTSLPAYRCRTVYGLQLPPRRPRHRSVHCAWPRDVRWSGADNRGACGVHRRWGRSSD